MRSAVFNCILFSLSFYCNILCNYCNAQPGTDSTATAAVTPPLSPINCAVAGSTLFLNSVTETDDWLIVTGPSIKGIQYPVNVMYTKPFPSWEMDRNTADSSYFKNCDWMVLPDKRKVINTVSREPLVFIKRFSTNAPSRVKLLVKMLYDNMAYLYIDSIRIPLNHKNPDINRFIKEISPELSSFVSIPATFNFGYNASFYAGDLKDYVLPAGDHVFKIELFNNANELGCIIKGMLVSGDGEKIFCGLPAVDEEKERAGVLIYRDEPAFPGNKTADTLYQTFLNSVKEQYWTDHLLADSQQIVSTDTLHLKRGDKVHITPRFITLFQNGKMDTSTIKGKLWKTTPANSAKKEFNDNFVFEALARGYYQLEMNFESPVDGSGLIPAKTHSCTRIIQVK